MPPLMGCVILDSFLNITGAHHVWSGSNAYFEKLMSRLNVMTHIKSWNNALRETQNQWLLLFSSSFQPKIILPKAMFACYPGRSEDGVGISWIKAWGAPGQAETPTYTTETRSLQISIVLNLRNVCRVQGHPDLIQPVQCSCLCII